MMAKRLYKCEGVNRVCLTQDDCDKNYSFIMYAAYPDSQINFYELSALSLTGNNNLICW